MCVNSGRWLSANSLSGIAASAYRVQKSVYALPSASFLPAAKVIATLMAGRTFDLAGSLVTATPDGGLLLDGGRVLVVSDLHLEKASSFAVRGVLLPPFDTAETLRRLSHLIARARPQRVVALGDSFHDTTAGRRMAKRDRDGLLGLTAATDFVWVEGNHDPEAPDWLPGARCESLLVDGLTLQHEPGEPGQRAEICGHLHPCARVQANSGTTRRRCFATDGQRLVMPAFGAFTGGLNLLDDAYGGLWSASVTALVMGHNKVHAVSGASLLPD
jgi:uncharacterized protein